MTKVKRNVIANYLGQGCAAIMGLAFIPLYIHYLGMEAYGLIGLFAVMQAWLPLLDAGMTPTLNREMARFNAGVRDSQSTHDLLRSLELVCLGLAAVIALGVYGVSGYLASHWLNAGNISPETIARAISIMGLVMAMRFCESIYAGSLIGLQKQVPYNSALAILATVRHGGAVAVLAWYSATIEAFFVWHAVMSLMAVTVLRVSVRRSLPKAPAQARFSGTAVAGICRFAGSMMGITLLGLLLTQTDKILLSRLLPLETFGYYALAAAVPGAIYLLITPITQALYPRMVELSSAQNDAALVALYHRAAQLVTVLTAPAAAMLFFFPGGVIFTWSGDPRVAENTAPILSLLALGTFLNGLMLMPYHFRLAHGWTGLTLQINTVAVLLLVPAILWFVPRYGAISAAWIWVVLNVGYVLIPIQIMHRRLIPREKWRWYLADVCLPAGGAGSVVLLSTLVGPARLQNRTEWLLFLLSTGLAALVVAAALADRIRGQWLAVRVRHEA